MKQAFVRLILKRSLMNATDTSAIDMVEVTAASVSRRKNSEDHSRGHGILQNTSGSVTKTRVAPRVLWSVRPKDVTAGKIISPIITAIIMSSAETVMAVFVSRVLAGKYDE